MSKDRHLNNPPATSIGMMEAWMHAAYQIMQKDPQPGDEKMGTVMTYLQIKRQWEDMAFMRLPLTAETTVNRIKRGFELLNLDKRIAHAFDMVREMYPDPTGHAPAGRVHERVREAVGFYKAGPQPFAANDPEPLSAVA